MYDLPIIISQQRTFKCMPKWKWHINRLYTALANERSKWLRKDFMIFAIMEFMNESNGYENAYPRALPAINSACELITSAMKSSLNASFAVCHLRPPGSTIGRSCGVRGPLLAERRRVICSAINLCCCSPVIDLFSYRTTNQVLHVWFGFFILSKMKRKETINGRLDFRMSKCGIGKQICEMREQAICNDLIASTEWGGEITLRNAMACVSKRPLIQLFNQFIHKWSQFLTTITHHITL